MPNVGRNGVTGDENESWTDYGLCNFFDMYKNIRSPFSRLGKNFEKVGRVGQVGRHFLAKKFKKSAKSRK